uniref:Transmembrane protein n=1 Tax=Trepomonas sp. PC1 TaxID=1076344 RepID=A0A146K3R0_9EUKA|eukprot:JAP90306.1 Hypothetical protein TPC1_30199 [Trepomonas sp. PC1]
MAMLIYTYQVLEISLNNEKRQENNNNRTLPQENHPKTYVYTSQKKVQKPAQELNKSSKSEVKTQKTLEIVVPTNQSTQTKDLKNTKLTTQLTTQPNSQNFTRSQQKLPNKVEESENALRLSKKAACDPSYYLNSKNQDCVSIRTCGEQMVYNSTEWEFSCEPCGVWVTGSNFNGLLGRGDTAHVQGFTNVSNACFDQIQIRERTTIASMGKKTYWAGTLYYLTYPNYGTNIVNFEVQSMSGRFGLGTYNLIYFENQRVFTSGSNQDQNLGAESATYDSLQVLTGFLMGQIVRQVGGTKWTSFIVTQSAIYSTNYATFEENGNRTIVSLYWGKMQLPQNVKVILKAQFSSYNVILVDQDHNYYANGYNGNNENMLCITGKSTSQFIELGKLRHVSIFGNFGLYVNLDNSVDICGHLQTASVTIDTTLKVNLQMPSGNLIDVSVNQFGANALVDNAGVRSVFYIGEKTFIYWDIGVGNTNPSDWTNLSTMNPENCSSFAASVYNNQALIYGCSRLQPFRYNGICYENCSYYVFYDNGLEKCIERECNYSYNLIVSEKRNWNICIECKTRYNDTDNNMLICRQSCLPTQTTYYTYLDKDEYFCADSADEIGNYTLITCAIFNITLYRNGFTCADTIDCGQDQLILFLSSNNFTCAQSESDPIFSYTNISNKIWTSNSTHYIQISSCPTEGCLNNNVCTKSCSNNLVIIGAVIGAVCFCVLIVVVVVVLKKVAQQKKTKNQKPATRAMVTGVV